MTKSYLFAAVTSMLLLVLVIPLLKDRLWMPIELASIATLSVISIAVGGLSAEIYLIVGGRKAVADLSGTNASKYFMSLVCSLLFLTIVTPSIQPAIDSTSVEGAAAIGVLFILSLALGGLTAKCLFAVLSLKATTKNTDRKNAIGGVPNASVDSSSTSLGSPSQVATEIDSRFNAFHATLETKMQELKQQLLGAIHDIGQQLSANAEISTKGPNTSVPSPAKDQVTEKSESPIVARTTQSAPALQSKSKQGKNRVNMLLGEEAVA